MDPLTPPIPNPNQYPPVQVGDPMSPHQSDQIPNEEKVQYRALCDADDDCKAIGYTNQYIGENIAMAGSHVGMHAARAGWEKFSLLGGVTAWFDEAKDFEWANPNNYHGVTGHWTAGVAAHTRYVGCGYAMCSTGSYWPDYPKWQNLVCKYFPGGNMGGENGGLPYDAVTPTGGPCSDCASDLTSCTGPNDVLCGGDMCLNCAVQFASGWPRRQCTQWTPDTCPKMFASEDGVVESTAAASTTGGGGGERESPANEPADGPSGSGPDDAMTAGSPRSTMVLGADYDEFEAYSNGQYGNVIEGAENIVRQAIGAGVAAVNKLAITVHGVIAGNVDTIIIDYSLSGGDIEPARTSIAAKIKENAQLEGVSTGEVKVESNAPRQGGRTGIVMIY